MEPRQTLSSSDMARELCRETKVPINSITGEKIDNLYGALSVPSYVHGYSLAIEYVRRWFLSKFKTDYFKTVYINGKHVLDDFKYFNKDNIKKEKPMVAIVPTVEFDFDRESLDMYLADPRIYLKKSNFQNGFFKDDELNQYLGMDMRALKMNFNFRIRVSSRAQQLDLYQKMELMFRIGATQREYISVDFHIPYDIMTSIAERAKFDVITTVDNKKFIKNIPGFLAYMNSHSELPITFKLRAINQKPEFFLRIKDLYTHISIKDKLSPDDGERNGHLDNDFHIDMALTLTMPIPHFYVYYSAHPLSGDLTVYEEDNSIRVGLYSFSDYEIPSKNNLGWTQLILSPYLCDKGEKFVDMSSIFVEGTNLGTVIKHSLDNYMSPNAYLDIKVFRNGDGRRFIRSNMNYETKQLELLEEVDEETIYIVVYADRGHINETLSTLENYKESRVEAQ